MVSEDGSFEQLYIAVISSKDLGERRYTVLHRQGTSKSLDHNYWRHDLNRENLIGYLNGATTVSDRISSIVNGLPREASKRDFPNGALEELPIDDFVSIIKEAGLEKRGLGEYAQLSFNITNKR